MRYTKEQVRSFEWGLLAGLAASVVLIAFVFTVMSIAKTHAVSSDVSSTEPLKSWCWTAPIQKPFECAKE